MTMTPDNLAELREYYDNAGTAEDMLTDDGRWETDIDPDPMVTTSLRLPKSLLGWVRDQAAEETGQAHRPDPPLGRGSSRRRCR